MATAERDGNYYTVPPRRVLESYYNDVDRKITRWRNQKNGKK